ncbi:MAG: DUF418 domain-containing protein [Acidimicrobiales bacterium]
MDAPATVSQAARTAPAPGATTPAMGITGGRRLEGIDVARALAFGGMLLAHFAVSSRPNDPGWLQALGNAADGRAAPLFATLLGVGAGILVSRRSPDRVLVLRGLALFAIGLAVWPLFDRVYLILPHYGLLLAAVPVVRRVSSGGLLGGAAVAFLVPSVVTALVDGHNLRGSPQPGRYGELTEVGNLIGNIFWSGGYPLVGWAGFALLGLWLSRQALARRAVQVTMLVAGSAVAALQPLAAAVFDRLGGTHNASDATGWAAFFDGAAHSNATAWYVIASGTAAAVIGGCLIVTPLFRTALRPVIALGQLALTAYLAHIALGTAVVWDWEDVERPPLAAQVWVVVLVFGAFAGVAFLWRLRWKRGPLEGLVRMVSSWPRPRPGP